MEFVMEHGGGVEANSLFKHLRDDSIAQPCSLKLARTDPFCSINGVSQRHDHHPPELKISSYGATLPSLLHSNSASSDHLGLVASDSSFYGGISSSPRAIIPFLQHAASASPYNPAGFPSSFNNNNGGPPSPFTLHQLRELRQQALIFKYMMSGVNVPLDLILPLRHSLLTRASALAGNVGWSNYHLSYAGNNDPEPGRCRRTDGKKWRCAREVVPDQKYCERHMHRGRNRARKGAENPAKSSSSQSSSTVVTISPSMSPNSACVTLGVDTSSSHSSIATKSLKPALDCTLFPSFQSPYTKDYRSFNEGSKTDMDLRSQMLFSRGLAQQQSPSSSSLSIQPCFKNAWPTKQQNTLILGPGYGGAEAVRIGHEPESQPLRHFFDDWPKSRDHPPIMSIWPSEMEECRAVNRTNTSVTQLSISIPMASSNFNLTPVECSPRDKFSFSPLKLSMSMSGEDDPLALGVGSNMGFGVNDEERNGKTNWIPIVWETSPLAEVLQSTSSTPRGSSKNSGLNLMTEGWENSSPRGSPTGVLQNATFGSLSDSGSGSSTPAPITKAHQTSLNNSCGGNNHSSDSFSDTNTPLELQEA